MECSPAGIENSNKVPCPTPWEIQEIFPPKERTNFFAIGNPKPTPPNFTGISLSTGREKKKILEIFFFLEIPETNGRKIFSQAAGEIPGKKKSKKIFFYDV